MPSPFPCSPVIRGCPRKKTQIEKEKKKLRAIALTYVLATYNIYHII